MRSLHASDQSLWTYIARRVVKLNNISPHISSTLVRICTTKVDCANRVLCRCVCITHDRRQQQRLNPSGHYSNNYCWCCLPIQLHIIVTQGLRCTTEEVQRAEGLFGPWCRELHLKPHPHWWGNIISRTTTSATSTTTITRTAARSIVAIILYRRRQLHKSHNNNNSNNLSTAIGVNLGWDWALDIQLTKVDIISFLHRYIFYRMGGRGGRGGNIYKAK